MNRRLLPVAMLTFLACGEETSKATRQDAVGTADENVTAALLPAVAVGTNVRVSRAPGPLGETDIAIDPTDANHILGGSRDLNAGPVRVYESFDGGRAWTDTALPFAPPPFDGGDADPGLAFDLAGDAYYSLIGSGDGVQSLFVSKKPHGASKFGAFVEVPNHDADKPFVTVDRTSSAFKNSVYVAWTDRPTAVTLSILLGRSTNGGASFAVEKVNNKGVDVIAADPAIGPDGELYVAWSDFAASDQTIFVNRSTDGGKTFGTTDHLIHHWVFATGGNPEGHIPAAPNRGVPVSPSIDVDRTGGPHRGTIYCAYNDATSKNGLDIFVQRSTNGGLTWSAPLRVNDDPIGVVHDQFMPRLAVDPSNGAVNVAFYDTRDDPANKKTNVFFARSVDGAVTFGANVKVTTAQTDETSANDLFGYGDYIGIASANGISWPLWTDSRTGDNQIFTASVQ